MKFMLFTPEHQYPSLECDSVRLNIADGADGSFSGSYGIRKGHAKAILSLKEGKILVSLGGKEVFSANCLGGVALVSGDEVRVTVEGIR